MADNIDQKMPGCNNGSESRMERRVGLDNCTISKQILRQRLSRVNVVNREVRSTVQRSEAKAHPVKERRVCLFREGVSSGSRVC
ncbi:hypothetical protein ScPMuIL_012679 [Solemya velum]